MMPASSVKPSLGLPVCTLSGRSSALPGDASPSSDGQSGSGLRAKSNSPPWPLRPHFLCSLPSPRGACRRDHCKNATRWRRCPKVSLLKHLPSSLSSRNQQLGGVGGVRGSPAPRPALQLHSRTSCLPQCRQSCGFFFRLQFPVA